MFSLKDYFFEVQLILNIFIITAIAALAFLYLKLSVRKNSSQLVQKIEYLCKNLNTLVEESEKSSDIIYKKIEEFKLLYDKNIAEIEKKTADLDVVISKLEGQENIKGALDEKDKYSKIKSLIREGHDTASIAKILDITKGEVELIHNILKQS